MIERSLWRNRIPQAWASRSIVWLSGVRRVGKTTLARMLPEAVYLNCDLPSVVRALGDPELFFACQAPGSVLVFYEVLWNECKEPFGVGDFDRRLLHGGLPEPLLAERKDAAFFSEWIDSFYARDILELFSIRNRQGFLTLFHLLLRHSGGQLDFSRLANLSELSRPTVKSHLEALQIAHAVHLLRPFHSGGKREVVARPKCYAFDTGFVTFEKGWNSIRDDDRGLLWEHLVLDSLRFHFADEDIFYWQDKSHREVDFVIRRDRDRVDLVECKINPDRLDPAPVEAFRALYPNGENFVVCPEAGAPHRVRRAGRVFTLCSTGGLH